MEGEEVAPSGAGEEVEEDRDYTYKEVCFRVRAM